MAKKGCLGRGVLLNITYYEIMTESPAGASPEAKSDRMGPGNEGW